MELRRTNPSATIPEIEEFFSKPNTSNRFMKQIAENVEIKELVNGNIEQQRLYINRTLTVNKWFNIAKKGTVLWSIAEAMMDVSNNNLSPVDVFLFAPNVGLFGIVFKMQIDEFSYKGEMLMFESINTWNEIVNWKNSKTYKNLGETDILLQYVEDKEKFNYTTPTSIRVLDRELAKKIFGFYPNYVNYNFPQGGEYFIPKYYAPYLSK